MPRNCWVFRQMGEDWDILWILYLGFAWFDMIYIYIYTHDIYLYGPILWYVLQSTKDEWITDFITSVMSVMAFQLANCKNSPGQSVVTIARPVGRSGAGLASAAVTGPGGGPRFGGVRAQRGQGGLEAPGGQWWMDFGWSDGRFGLPSGKLR